MLSRLRSLWRALVRRRDFEREMDAEIAFHLEARAAELVGRGLSPPEAARLARVEFGGRQRFRDECRQSRGLRFFDDLRADLRYAWRSLRRSPGASAVAVVILGLAIGANVALFTFLDAYLLGPLPISAADRHVELARIDERGQRSSGWAAWEISVVAEATTPRAFEGLYGSRSLELALLEPARRLIYAQAVTASYFSLLGARLARGRPFRDSEYDTVAVLSDAGWRRLFDGDPGVLGRRVRMAGSWFTVIGVTAPEFRGVEAVVPELWIPMTVHRDLADRTGEVTPRYDLAGLLRPGVSPEAAAALAAGVVASLDPQRRGPVVEPRPSLLRASERAGLSVIAALVLAAFGLVLLIACANLASLHLARACARHREIATRLALGASRRRLVRQLLTESLLLSSVAALLGCAVAVAATDTLQGRLFAVVTEAGMTVSAIEVRPRVLGFAVFLGVVAGLALGLLPALEATSPDLASGSRRDGVALGGRARPQRLAALLATAQVAASLVLLVLASLLLRSARSASHLDAGYEVAGLIDAGLARPTPGAVDRLRQDPQIAAAAAVGHTPLSGSAPRHPMRLGLAGAIRPLRYNQVDHAYFATLGVDLLEGRGFRPEETALGAHVVVVSAATARAAWPPGTALGRTIEVTEAGGPRRGTYQVVGVAPDVMSGLFFQGRDASAVYFPAGGWPRAGNVLVRARGEAAAVVEALRRSCAEIDPDVVCSPRPLRALAAMQRFPFLVASVVATALGALAAALTLIGLHGIVAFAAVQRVREVGVRIALGATSGEVVRLLVGRAARSVAIGVALGMPVCLVLSRLAARYFGLRDAFDAATLAGVPVLLATVALAAALAPARRATTVDPVVSLRAD